MQCWQIKLGVSQTILTEHSNCERGFLPEFAVRISKQHPALHLACASTDADPLNIWRADARCLRCMLSATEGFVRFIKLNRGWSAQPIGIQLVSRRAHRGHLVNDCTMTSLPLGHPQALVLHDHSSVHRAGLLDSSSVQFHVRRSFLDDPRLPTFNPNTQFIIQGSGKGSVPVSMSARFRKVSVKSARSRSIHANRVFDQLSVFL